MMFGNKEPVISREQRDEHKDQLLKPRAKKMFEGLNLGINKGLQQLSNVFDATLTKLGLGDVADDMPAEEGEDVMDILDSEESYDIFLKIPRFLRGLFVDTKLLRELKKEYKGVVNNAKVEESDLKVDISLNKYENYKPYKEMILSTVALFKEPPLPGAQWVSILGKENANPPAIDTQIGDDTMLTGGEKTAIGQVFPRALKDAKKYLKDQCDIDVPGDIKDLSLEQQFQVAAAYIHQFYKETGDRKEAVLRYHCGSNGKPANDTTARKWIINNGAILDAYNKNHSPQVEANAITADQYREGAINYYELA